MMIEPTVEQVEHGAIVQQEFVELINRLVDEGIDRRVVMAGLSAATAASILRFYGPREVPVWFAKQSVLSSHLADDRK